MVIREYSSDYEYIWNQFVSTSKNSFFMFNRNYMDYHSGRFEDNSLLFYDNETLIALLPANRKENDIISHGGLTFGGLLIGDKTKQHTVNECFSVLIEYAKRNNIEKIHYKAIPHIYHKQPAEEELYALFSNGAQITDIGVSTIINLENPLKMPKGRKAQISRATREGIEVKKVSEKKWFDIFIDMENDVLLNRHNTRAVHTSDELYMLYQRFPQNIYLYGAFAGDDMIAGTVIYESEQVVHTQYMATNDYARTVGALDLTINTIINDYKNNKRWLDFGISTEHGRIYLNEGLAAQKEGFGGRTNVYQQWTLKI